MRTISALDCTADIILLEHPAEFIAYKEAWLALEQAASEPQFFQSYAWCGHVASAMLNVLPESYRPLVTVLAVNGVVTAIWPLSCQKRSGTWYLAPLDDPFGQFAGILARDTASAQSLVRETLAAACKHRLADMLRLDRVLVGSTLEAALKAEGAAMRGTIDAPVVDLTPWPSMKELKSSRNKKTMKNLRNATNRLSKAGAYEHRVAVETAGVSEVIEATLRLRSAWLAAKGLTAPQFRSPAHHDVLTGGAEWGLDRQRAGFELLCEGKPIAHQWGFLHGNRYYAYMSATDPEAVHLSPGRLHLAFVIEDAMCLGVGHIELMTPASDYKMVWTDTVRQLANFVVPLTLRGKIQDRIWERTIRPLAKACFYALPASLRKRVVSHDQASSSSHADSHEH